MEIIVDASAVIAVIVEESARPEILRLTAGRSLSAPQSLRYEIGNSLSRMLKMKRIEIETAQRAFSCYESIPIRHIPVNMSGALGIAAEHNIYAYDAYMIEVACRLGAPLLTLDIPLSRIATKAGLDVLTA
jgi:predicted nucleic acid-binding protein